MMSSSSSILLTLLSLMYFTSPGHLLGDVHDAPAIVLVVVSLRRRGGGGGSSDDVGAVVEVW